MPAIDIFPEVWQAEVVIRAVFDFRPDEELQLERSQCLSWIEDGTKRCTFRDESNWTEPARCSQRSELLKIFLAHSTAEDPMHFKAAVMRFIELAACRRYNHVTKVTDVADIWFKRYGDDTAPVNGIEMKPYIRGRDTEQLRRLMEEPLDHNDVKKGQLYMWVTPDVPGYIKIGCTTYESLECRFKSARRDCGIQIKQVYTTGMVPHAKRLEAIVHNELADRRYRFANPCTFCLKRPKRHEEWFQTTLEHAQGVVQHWKDWLLKGMYDIETGGLSQMLQKDIRLSASPEQIENRERRFSPQFESTRPMDSISSQKIWYDLPIVKQSDDTFTLDEVRSVLPASLAVKESKAHILRASRSLSNLPMPIGSDEEAVNVGHTTHQKRSMSR